MSRMPDAAQILVFDTGPLSHLAQQGWLGVLRFVTGERTAIIPEAVVAELREGLPGRPHLRLVLDATWIEHRDLVTDAETAAFREFSRLLVVGGRNRGEAAVLAYAREHGGIAVLDDGPGRKAATARGVQCQGTLALLCEAVREGQLTLPLISALADHLLESEYRLPFSRGGFEQWARKNDLLPVDPAEPAAR
jgi:predicted nucleic acid-binding protein